METPGEVFRLDSVGLTMNLPPGAIAQTSRVGDQLTVQVSNKASNPDWLYSIRTPQSSDFGNTAPAVASALLDQLLGSVGQLDRTVDKNGKVTEKVVSTKGVVLQPVKELGITTERPDQARPAARFYVKLPGGDKEPAVVRGYTVFCLGQGRFVTFDLTTTEPAFPAAKQAYETSIATARFADAAALTASRGAAVESGIDFLKKLSGADYDAAMGQLKDQWYRFSKRAANASDADAQEIAYKHVRVWQGKRGEIDPSRPVDKFKGPELQDGYLVRIDARTLEGPRTIDSVGVYFMSGDRKEEAWTLQMAVREPARKKPAIYNETGARSGRSMSVSVSGDGMESKAMQPLVPGDGYINQVEMFILPQLLVRARITGELGFYSYQSGFENIQLRRDTVTQPADRPGAWQISTRVSEDRDPYTSLLNERGDLIQTTLPTDVQGEVPAWTPVTLQRLVELWQAKGLPMN
jgi:hypothetical protein